ncbi:MAG TPA: PaaI family thioesterase [Myxococcota bacterium]|nr:PaaI family thioesterase [Myxococcota bacterium]
MSDGPPDSDFTREIGMEMGRVEDGVCVIELELDARHMSVAQRAHGGVLFTMLDTAMGRAVISRLPPGRGCATVEAKINYLRPIQAGRLRAEGRALDLTRRTAYAEGTVRDDQGRVLARSSGTFFLTDTIAQSERERV